MTLEDIKRQIIIAGAVPSKDKPIWAGSKETLDELGIPESQRVYIQPDNEERTK